jgi:hypothetical protein
LTLHFHPDAVILIIFFSDKSIFDAKAAFRKISLNNCGCDGFPRYVIPHMASMTFYFLISVGGIFLSISHNKKHTRHFQQARFKQ